MITDVPSALSQSHAPDILPQPNVGFILLLGVLIAAFGGSAILFGAIDSDCFWHLKVAEQLRHDGIGPLIDRMSFASIQQPWTPYSWLAELGMKAVWDAGGYRLALSVQAAMQAAFVLGMVSACRFSLPSLPPQERFLPITRSLKQSGQWPTATACCVAAAVMGIVSLPYLSFRPVTASLVLQGICTILITRDRSFGERSRLIWLVPLLTIVIINIHLNAVFIPLGCAALLAGAVWERLAVAQPPERPEAGRRVARLFVLTAACSIACCCTPMLAGTVRTALYYRSADPMVASGYLAEMRPFFMGSAGSVRALLAGLSVVAILFRLKWFRPGDRLLLAIGLVLLSQWGRFAPIFALYTTPMLATAIGRIPDGALLRLPVKLALAMCIAIAGAAVFTAFPAADISLATWSNRTGAGGAGCPDAAAHYVTDHVHARTGRLISEFDWGGYLEWSLGDRYQLLLDGRTQLFTADFWQSTYLCGDTERATFLAQVDADAAVLPVGRSMFRHALFMRGWRSVWRDDRAEVMLPPTRPVAEAAAPDSKAKRWGKLSALFPD